MNRSFRRRLGTTPGQHRRHFDQTNVTAIAGGSRPQGLMTTAAYRQIGSLLHLHSAEAKRVWRSAATGLQDPDALPRVEMALMSAAGALERGTATGLTETAHSPRPPRLSFWGPTA